MYIPLYPEEVQPEEVRHPCAFHVINRARLRHSFYISRPRSHINLYIECDFNYKEGARMSYLLWPCAI